MKLTRNEIIKKRSHILLNTFGYVKLENGKYLHDVARKWSDEHIADVYGINVSKIKSVPKVRQISEQTKKEKFRQYENFKSNIKEYGVKESFEMRKTSKKKKIIIADESPRSKILRIRNRKPFEERKREWHLYSKHREEHPEEEFPAFLLQEIERININAGLDLHSHYGFSVMNYIYVRGDDFETAIASLRLDPQSERGYYYKGEELFNA